VAIGGVPGDDAANLQAHGSSLQDLTVNENRA
jgi:hypothetical protein